MKIKLLITSCIFPALILISLISCQAPATEEKINNIKFATKRIKEYNKKALDLLTSC